MTTAHDIANAAASQAEAATVRAPKTNLFDIDRIALERAWSGEFAALWRAPSSLAQPLSVDARGPSVEWVRTQLTPRYVTAGSPAVLDTAMQEAVRRFQTERGLLSDGVVGPETLLALAADSDNGPRLLRVLE